MVASPAGTPRVAIVGAGIGGVAAAAFLRHAGLPAVVYEQAAQLTEVGAGLVLAPNAVRLLRRLGVMDKLLGRAVPLDVGWEFRRWENGQVLSAEDLAGSCERLYGERTYTIHRADLLTAITSVLPAGAVHLQRHCAGVSVRSDCAVLAFTDGTSAEADVVIGADGVHSTVRGAVTEPSPARYSGMCAFRALVPADRAPGFARRRAQTLWIGPGHHLVHYPISGGAAVNLFACAPAAGYTTESWSATATVDELLAEFTGWDHRLHHLVQQAGLPGRWALLDREPLSRWSRGPITLLGDAAHPMFPFFAQGAAQAIEDAAVLARCLAEDTHTPARALRRYESLRIERTTRLQQVSHARAHINHLPDGPEQEARDQSLAGQDPLIASGWIYAYDPETAGSGTADRRHAATGKVTTRHDSLTRSSAMPAPAPSTRPAEDAVLAPSPRPRADANGPELFSEERSAEVVAASFAGTPDPRLKHVLTTLVRHLHAFVKDVALTEEEWARAIAFLTATGQKCDDVRQEFILLSDILGVSMLVETINHRTGGTSTESTVLGPFHMVESPPRELGDNIALDNEGEPCLVTGRVTGPDGEPLAGALVDVWQANAAGFYDVQQPGVQPELNLRGLFTADGDGRFWFRTIVPRYYPVPSDGPAGQLLAATGRHPNRPAHVHFIVSAVGHRPVTTHLFVDDSPYLDSDAVFGVKESLVRQFPVIDDPAQAAEAGLPCPFRTVHFGVTLAREEPSHGC
jgi:2-polyprenyl-6-methoxyphenol hydroxylase-like FAD-dependent oxidoreductase/protocatechuate 3,4-dioxygenase beta subunit